MKHKYNAYADLSDVAKIKICTEIIKDYPPNSNQIPKIKAQIKKYEDRLHK